MIPPAEGQIQKRMSISPSLVCDLQSNINSRDKTPHARGPRRFGKMSLSDYSCNSFSAAGGSGSCFAGAIDDGLAKGINGNHYDRGGRGGRSSAAWPRRAGTGATLAAAPGPYRALRRRRQFRRDGADSRTAARRRVRPDVRRGESSRCQWCHCYRGGGPFGGRGYTLLWAVTPPVAINPAKVHYDP